MKTFNDSKSQHLEELEALISSSLSEKELEDRLSDYHDNDIAEILEKLMPQERLRLYRILGVDRTAEIFASVHVRAFTREGCKCRISHGL